MLTMLKRGWLHLAFALGPFVAVASIAQAGAGAESDGDRPLNVCFLSDGASCEPEDTDAGPDGSVSSDASDAQAEDAAPDAGAGADAAPEDAAASTGDAASPDADSGIPPGGSNGSSGCGCSVVGTESGGAGLLLVSGAIALLGARARRSRRRAWRSPLSERSGPAATPPRDRRT
jgi:hypothetical protein